MFLKLINKFSLFFFVSGYLKKKTVILITHQLQYLDSVDQIVLLENVRIYLFNVIKFKTCSFVFINLHYKFILTICHHLQGAVSAVGSNETLQKSGLDFTKLMSEKETKEVVEEKPVIRTLGSRQSSIQVCKFPHRNFYFLFSHA